MFGGGTTGGGLSFGVGGLGQPQQQQQQTAAQPSAMQQQLIMSLTSRQEAVVF